MAPLTSLALVFVLIFVLYLFLNPRKVGKNLARKLMLPDWKPSDFYGTVDGGKGIGDELLLLPFSAERIPSITNGKLTYADTLDPIKKVGGIAEWFNGELVNELASSGCAVTKIAEEPSMRNQFQLTGEILNIVRTQHMGKVAFRVQLHAGGRTLMTKVYTSTSRHKNAQKVVGYEWTDMVIGRKSTIDKASQNANGLLDTALADSLASVSNDLKRILPRRKVA